MSSSSTTPVLDKDETKLDACRIHPSFTRMSLERDSWEILKDETTNVNAYNTAEVLASFGEEEPVMIGWQRSHKVG